MDVRDKFTPVRRNATILQNKLDTLTILHANHTSGQLPSISAPEFTGALSQAANGVSIVTTSYDTSKAGLTVSSMCSVCAEPALLLVCVNSDNEFCELALQSGHFVVNVLPTGAEYIASVFAGLIAEYRDKRFDVGSWTSLTTGSPALQGALVALDCQLESSQTHGTHRVFFGRVIDVCTQAGSPLVYCDRQFGEFLPTR